MKPAWMGVTIRLGGAEFVDLGRATFYCLIWSIVHRKKICEPVENSIVYVYEMIWNTKHQVPILVGDWISSEAGEDIIYIHKRKEMKTPYDFIPE